MTCKPVKIIWLPFFYVISSPTSLLQSLCFSYTGLLTCLRSSCLWAFALAFLLLGIFFPQISVWLSQSLIPFWFLLKKKFAFFGEAFLATLITLLGNTSCLPWCFIFFFLVLTAISHLIYFTNMCCLFSTSPTGMEAPWRQGFMCLVTNECICPLNSTWHVLDIQ